MSEKENMRLMQTLDDAWNSQDWETFKKRHATDTAVYWPGQSEPTRGRENHFNEAVEFFKTFDNKLVNRPYKILFGQGDYTCSIADWTVTMVGPMKMPDGKVFSPRTKRQSLSSAPWLRGRTAKSPRRDFSMTSQD